MNPRPDHGESSYNGSGRLRDKKVLITGGDSGIGRAVALAFAREGAHLLVSYLDEDQDAEATRRLVTEAGRQCLLAPGDIGKAAHCRALVDKTVEAFGHIDVLVNNAAHQMSFNAPEEISGEEWERSFAVNISAICSLTPPRSTPIAQAHFCWLTRRPRRGPELHRRLAQDTRRQGHRVNAMAPGPVWTPLILLAKATWPDARLTAFDWAPAVAFFTQICECPAGTSI